MPKISGIEPFRVNIPFKRAFKHSLKSRGNSESIFVKVTLDNGVVGFGESLPRSYVTGNTQSVVFAQLKKFLPKCKSRRKNLLKAVLPQANGRAQRPSVFGQVIITAATSGLSLFLNSSKSMQPSLPVGTTTTS